MTLSKFTNQPANEEIVNTINDIIETMGTTTGANIDLSNLSSTGEAKFTNILEQCYPVGSIYMSVNNVSPATLFGFGTWEQIKDTFLLACGDTYSNADTGGASTVTLTTNEIPSHNHSASSDSTGAHTHAKGTFEITGSVNFRNDFGKYQRATGSGAFSATSSGTVARPDGGGDVGETSYNRTASFKASDNWSGATQSKGDHSHTITVNNNGGGQAHNNMPPYLAVNIWKRTA